LFYLSFCQVHQNEDCENCNSWFVMFDILSKVFMPPRLRVGGGGGILIYPCPSVRPDIDTWFVRLSPTVLELQATALKFCRMFIHTMEVCMSTGDWFSSNILKMTGSWTCHFVRPSGYRYMVCPAISSYSFRATASIFFRMFIHIMVVCMSTGFWFSSNIW
jgi:hypothetical protein